MVLIGTKRDLNFSVQIFLQKAWSSSEAKHNSNKYLQKAWSSSEANHNSNIYLQKAWCSSEQNIFITNICYKRHGGAVHHCLCLRLLQLHWWHLRDDRIKGLLNSFEYIFLHIFVKRIYHDDWIIDPSQWIWYLWIIVTDVIFILNCADNLQAEEANDGFLLFPLASRHWSYSYCFLGPVCADQQVK